MLVKPLISAVILSMTAAFSGHCARASSTPFPAGRAPTPSADVSTSSKGNTVQSTAVQTTEEEPAEPPLDLSGLIDFAVSEIEYRLESVPAEVSDYPVITRTDTHTSIHIEGPLLTALLARNGTIPVALADPLGGTFQDLLHINVVHDKLADRVHTDVSFKKAQVFWLEDGSNVKLGLSTRYEISLKDGIGLFQVEGKAKHFAVKINPAGRIGNISLNRITLDVRNMEDPSVTIQGSALWGLFKVQAGGKLMGMDPVTGEPALQFTPKPDFTAMMRQNAHLALLGPALIFLAL